MWALCDYQRIYGVGETPEAAVVKTQQMGELVMKDGRQWVAARQMAANIAGGDFTMRECTERLAAAWQEDAKTPFEIFPDGHIDLAEPRS